MNTRWLFVAVAVMLIGSSVASQLQKNGASGVEAFKPLGNECDVCIGLINTDIQFILDAIVGTQ